MQSTDLKDFDGIPEATASTSRTMVVNAVHLLRLLRASPYPPAEGGLKERSGCCDERVSAPRSRGGR